MDMSELYLQTSMRLSKTSDELYDLKMNLITLSSAILEGKISGTVEISDEIIRVMKGE